MQTKAEIYLGGYEALHHVLKSPVFMPSPSSLSLLMRPYNISEHKDQVKPHIDYFVQIFLENINALVEVGYLTRARRAILIDWKVNIYSIDFLFSLLVTVPKLRILCYFSF